MAARDALARLFLAGRSPEEQAARLARQHQQSGLGGGGGAFPPAPQGAPPLDMTQAGPWGAGRDPMTTGGGGGVPVPTPRPSQFSLPQEAPIPVPSPGMFPPDLAVSPPMPPDPMAASAPTNATLPFVPGSSRMPPDLGVSPLMPPDPMAASAPTSNPPPPLEIAPSPARPRDPMAASAPTEIGAFNAAEQGRQFGLPRQKKPEKKPEKKESPILSKKRRGVRSTQYRLK